MENGSGKMKMDKMKINDNHCQNDCLIQTLPGK